MSDLRRALDAARGRFCQRARDDRVQLRAAVAAGDLLSTSSIAHRLAGSAAMYGYPAASEAGEALETVLSQHSSLTCQIIDAVDLLCAELEKLEED